MASGSSRLPNLPACVIATSFGAGFSPVAPGTVGTLTAVPMAWAAARLGRLGFALVALGIAAVGTWAASAFVRASGRDDDQRIVVDEVAGYFVTLLLVKCTIVHLCIAFVLFRLFDIWKPPPVRQLDRHVGGGFGVMADDLAAGVYGALILFALDRAGVVAWIAARVHA
jgi:phosphatidylglycerophosphatase A